MVKYWEKKIIFQNNNAYKIKKNENKILSDCCQK